MNRVQQVRIALVTGALLTLSFVPLAHAEGRIWLVTEPSPGMPPCEEFYDKWDVPGMPAGLPAMAGFSREVFAAKACLDKNDVAMACKHWQGLLAVIDKLGPPWNERRGEIEELMQQKECQAAPASDSTAVPDSPPGSESAPASPSDLGSQSTPALATEPGTDSTPGAGH